MKTRLTKKIIAAQPLPPKGRTILTDTEFPGLSLAIYSSGKRTWHLYYRTAEKAQRNAKVGSYPVLSIDAARTLAREWLADVSRGKDPVAVKKENANRKSVGDLVGWFVSHHLPKLRPSTQAEYQRIIDKHILPGLGKQPLDRVTPETVQALHRKMGSTPRMANLTMAILRKMFNQAIDLGWRTEPRNPVRGLRKYKENQSSRYLEKPEFQRLWQVLAEEQRDPYNGDGILALQLLLLTGRRKSEILTLKWSDLDLKRGRMMLADSKAGRPMEYQLSPVVVRLLDDARAAREPNQADGSTRMIPLAPSSRTQAVGPATGDRSAPPRKGEKEKPVNEAPSPFVIRGRTGGTGHLVGLQKIWERVRVKAGLEDVRLHDLRHSYASMAIESGAELAQVKELLGHRNIATTLRYVHLYTDTIRESLAKVEAGILGAVEGGPKRDAA